MRNIEDDDRRRVVLYARTATGEQHKGTRALDAQMEVLREYAAREGYEVLEEMTDAGWSGSDLERPGLNRVRQLVAGGCGDVSTVLAVSRDRFSRSVLDLFLLEAELGDHSCGLRGLREEARDA